MTRDPGRQGVRPPLLAEPPSTCQTRLGPDCCQGAGSNQFDVFKVSFAVIFIGSNKNLLALLVFLPRHVAHGPFLSTKPQ